MTLTVPGEGEAGGPGQGFPPGVASCTAHPPFSCASSLTPFSSPERWKAPCDPCSETFHELLPSKSPPLAPGCASHFPAQHSAEGSASCWVISFIPQPRTEGKDVPCTLLGFEVTDSIHTPWRLLSREEIITQIMIFLETMKVKYKG